VGTNGIGTALQRNSTVAVIGNEHYADGLANLACFGAPSGTRSVARPSACST